MIVLKIILICFQLILMINLLIFSYLKKSITKEIHPTQDTYFILIMRMHDSFRNYILYGIFMLPFIIKIKKEFIKEFNMDMIKMELDKIKMLSKLKGYSNLSNDEEKEKIKQLESKIRNIELKQKINKIRKRKKLWV